MPERYKWQIEAFNQFKDRQYGGLDASCGLGKTICLSDIAKHKKLPVIIIAPKTICGQWKNELMAEKIPECKIWVHDQQTMTKQGQIYKREFATWATQNRGHYLIVPTQNFSLGMTNKKKISVENLPFVVQIMLGAFGKNLLCILDESSWIKSSSPVKSQQSIRSKMVIYLGNLVCEKMIATGTFITKSPMNAYNQISFLDDKFFKESPDEFFRKYTITKTYYFGHRQPTVTAIKKDEHEDIRLFLQGQYGLSKFNGGKDKAKDMVKIMMIGDKHNLAYEDVDIIANNTKYWPYRNLDDLYKRLDKVLYRVRRKDVFDIKHDKFVYEPIIIPVTLSNDQIALYKKIVKDGFTNNFYLGQAAGAELLTRCQDICLGQEPLKDDDGNVTYIPFKDNPKLDALMELIESIDDDEQIVVWSTRIIGLKSIAERLEKDGISFTTYSGQQTAEEKSQAETLFSEKKVRVFIANPAAAGFGLNALRDCNYMVWYAINDSVEQYHQAQHRILRGESKAPKFAYSLMCKGTVEERQFDNIKRGEEFLQIENTIEGFAYDK